MIRLIHRGRPECQQVCLLLDDFISGELSIETGQQILSHLDTCPDCRAQKRVCEKMRRAVKSAYYSEPVPAHLEDSIRRTVGRYDFLSVRTLSIAAGLIAPFFLALFFLLSNPSFFKREVVVDHFRAVAEDHLDCQGKRLHEANLLLLPELNEVEKALSRREEDGYVFVEVTECQLDGESFLHYKFQGREGSFSLMVEDRDSTETLPASRFARSVSDVRVYTAHQYGVGLASLSGPKHFVYLLAEGQSQEEVASLAGRVIPTLKRTLFEAG